MKSFKKMFTLILAVIMLVSVFMPLSTFAQNSLTGKIYAFDENGNEIKDICNLTNVTVGVMLEGTIPKNTHIYIAVYSDDKLVNVHTKTLNSYDLYTVMHLSLPGTTTQKIKAFVWDGNNIPLSNTIDIASAYTTYIDNTHNIQLTTGYKYASSLGAENLSDYYISVYNPNTDRTNTLYDLDENAKVYINGKYLASVREPAVLANMHSVSDGSNANLGKYYAPNSGNIKLIDADADGDYDELFVKSYETVIVDEAYLLKAKFSAKSGNTIDLTAAEYSITMDGNGIDIRDLKEWDVLSIAVTADRTNYEIIGTRKPVQGTIDTMDVDYGIYEINGTEYTVANMADPIASNLRAVIPGDEGIFYIDAFGGIAYFDRIVSHNYGFITGASNYYYVGDNYYNVEILDKNGNISTYTLADSVKVTEAGFTYLMSADYVYDKIAALKDDSGWVLKLANANDAPAWEHLDNYASRLITYTVNSSGMISEISFADYYGCDLNIFNCSGYLMSAKYNANLSALGAYGVTEDTVVFSLPIKANSTKDDFEVTTIDSLGDGNDYDVAFYNVDEDNNAGALVIINNDATIGAGTSLAVLTKLMTAKNENAETVYNITFLQGGEEKTLTTTSDLYEYIWNDGYAPGDVFEYAVNSKGEMSKIAFGAAVDIMLKAEAAKTGFAVEYNDNAPFNQAQYVFGAVYAKTSNRVITIAEVADGTFGAKGRHKILDDANITVVDLSRPTTSPLRVKTGSYEDIQPMYFDNTGKISNERDVSVLMKYYKNEITDVIVYLHYGEIYGGMTANDNLTIPEDTPMPSRFFNYGFIMGASEYSPTGGISYDLQILNRNGSVSIHSLADNVKLTQAGTTVYLDAGDVYDEIAALKDDSGWVLKLANANDAPDAADLDNYANRLITYTVNDQAKITAIAFADELATDVNSFNLNDQSTTAKYNANLSALGAYGVTEDTVVFSLPVKYNASKDDFEVTTIDTLGDGDSYFVAFYNVDEDNNAGALVIINNDATVGAGTSLAILTKLMTAKNENAETVYNITFLQGGEEKTLTTTSDLYEYIWNDGYARGDVFEYAVNSKGEMSKIAFGAAVDIMLKAEAAKTGFAVEYNDNAPFNQAQYVFGAVYAKTSNRVITIAEVADGTFGAKGRHKIPDDANVVIVDLTKPSTASSKVQIGEYGDIQAIYTINGKIDLDRDISVLLKYYKNKVTDVIVYLGYAAEYGWFDVIQ